MVGTKSCSILSKSVKNTTRIFETHTNSGVVEVAIFLQGRRVVEMDGVLIRGLASVSNRNIKYFILSKPLPAKTEIFYLYLVFHNSI